MLPIVPSAASLVDGPTLQISPTDISQFVRLDQCERYLRLRMRERVEGTRFLREYGVVPQAIPPLLTKSGAAFETTIEGAAGQRYPTVRLRAKARQSAGRVDDNAPVIAAASALPPGKVTLLFQPRLEVELDGGGCAAISTCCALSGTPQTGCTCSSPT